ncbi:MAG: hypothetical protein H6733_00395 [Alphaproteobacteria bacterium]|nr:hypothetical protein [Alphaproteobacteria bacterium]
MLPMIGGCAGGELPGYYYELTLETSQNASGGLKDECNDPPVASKEVYEYRLVLSGNNAQIYVDGGFLATGALALADLTYQSPIYTENRGRPDWNVRWAIRGDAQVQFGSSGSWTGEERIDVVNSTDPEVPAGCAYWYDVTGTYIGEVE